MCHAFFTNYFDMSHMHLICEFPRTIWQDFLHYIWLKSTTKITAKSCSTKLRIQLCTLLSCIFYQSFWHESYALSLWIASDNLTRFFYLMILIASTSCATILIFSKLCGAVAFKGFRWNQCDILTTFYEISLLFYL